MILYKIVRLYQHFGHSMVICVFLKNKGKKGLPFKKYNFFSKIIQKSFVGVYIKKKYNLGEKRKLFEAKYY